MVTRGRAFCLLSISTFLIIWNVFSVSARMSKKIYSPMNSDIPFIKCDVCMKGVKYLYRKAESMRQELPKQKVTEEKLQELLEKACNPEKFEGEWIAKLDVEERDSVLHVTEQKDLGSCKAECRTVAKACEETIGDADVDIAEELWKDEKSLSKLINQVCYSETKACVINKQATKFKSGTRKDEKFQVMSEDEQKAQEYMKRASDMPGMPNMQMYSRDEMEQMVKKEGNGDSSGDSTAAPAQTSSKEHGSILWHTIVQIFRDLWAWIRNILGLKTTTKQEL